MLVTVRKRGQITIPRPMMERFNLEEGDVLDCTAEDECISLVPVKVVPVLKKT